MGWSVRRVNFIWVLVLAASPVLLRAQTTVVREGDGWYFFRGVVEPPYDWLSPAFDPAAAAWESGPTGIGYDDDDDATVLSDMQNSYLSVYLRINFEVPQGLQGFLWQFAVRYDDGFVAYVDGVEVARRGLSGSPPPFNEAAVDHEITVGAGQFDEVMLLLQPGSSEPLVLSPGIHTLAAQVHNTNLASSDLSFSAELRAQPFIVLSVEPRSGLLSGGNPVTISGLGFSTAESTTVFFGGVPSPAVTVVSSTELEATVPAATVPGTVDVEVEDSRGRVSLPGAYTYRGPGSGGLSFGSNQYARVGSDPGITAEGTFEFWVNRQDDFRNRWRTLVAAGNAQNADVLLFEIRSDGIRARQGQGGLVTLSGNAEVGEGEWHHVAYAFSGTTRSLYFDGRLVASDELAQALPAGARFRVGRPFGFGSSLTATLDSVRFWSVERSEDEILRALYREIEVAPGLAGSWPLEEGSGQIARGPGGTGTSLVLGETTNAEGSDPQWVTISDFPWFAVTAILPASGALSGGYPVQFFGTGFDAANPPRIFFGGSAALATTVADSWEMTVTVPGGAGFGAVDVAVEAAAGTITLPGAFTYEPEALYAFCREGKIWDYFLGTSQPPDDWTRPDFDPLANGWPSGPSGLGYADGDDATELPQMEGAILTLYARTDFWIWGNGSPINYLRLLVRYDDGYVAYLNGTEIARANIAGQPPRFDETASALHEITGGAGHFDEEIDVLAFKGALQEGKNTLAVEVHNGTLDSTDLSLSAELIYSAPGASFTRGDVDSEFPGLNITDAVKLLRFMFMGDSIPCLEAGDVEDDGRLTVTDAIRILRHLFRGEPAPPEPFLVPGPDLDDDPLDCQG